jgi:hypothetical protein
MIEDFLAVARDAHAVPEIDQALLDPAFQARDQRRRDIGHRSREPR